MLPVIERTEIVYVPDGTSCARMSWTLSTADALTAIGGPGNHSYESDS
mgnify:CR=1 FL=1